MINNIKKTAMFVISIAGIIALMTFTNIYKSAVSEAIFACGNILIPSLFPFIFLSSFIVYTDSFSIINNHCNFIKKLFGIPKEGLIAIIMCLIGGFPVGAKTVCALYESGKISAVQCEKLYYCCVGAGPGFLISFIGENIFLSKKAGILLFISNGISVLILLLINRKKNDNYTFVKKIQDKITLGNAVVLSTESAVKSTLSMCGFVIIFMVINNILSMVPIHNMYLASMLEITGGIIKYGNQLPYEGIAFLVGFGGICVHFQIFGIIKKIKINKTYFFIMRILEGLISAVIFHFLLLLFPVAITTFSNIDKTLTPRLSGTLWGSIAIILLSIVFLISIHKKNNNQEVNLCAE
jgi:hypothetical protein